MNKFRKKILLAAAILSIAANLFVATKPAKAFLPFYGGTIVGYIPPTHICPGITLVFDFVTGTVIRLYRAPFSIIYPFFNIYTQGTFVKGLDTPVPYPTCPAAVFPILMIGTS